MRAIVGKHPNPFFSIPTFMAASSSTAIPTVAIPTTAIPTTIPTMLAPNHIFHEKLEGPNYLSWLTQFLQILRSTDSMGFIDGLEPCPPKFLSDDSNKQTLNLEFTIW
jgi:hypothetical protein